MICKEIKSNYDEETIEKISQKLTSYAVRSLLYEVSTTPKPGLVDRSNSGAHDDMDFFTFMNSSAALANYFFKCSRETFIYINSLDNVENINYQVLFERLKSLGIKAEENMFEATNNVNTHKGLVFSLGIFVSAEVLRYCKTGEKVSDIDLICIEVSNLTKGIMVRNLNNIMNKEKLTAGERQYFKYGIKGIRGEAEAGYPIVREIGYPMIKKLFNQFENINDLLVQVLLHLMTRTNDTNILNRHNPKTLTEVKNLAEKALKLGGMLTDNGKQFILKMDQHFTKNRISPGGSADLLAVTIFVWLLCDNRVK